MNKNVTIVLVRTSHGKLVFKPFGYNKFLMPVFGFFLQSFSGGIMGLLIGLVLDMNFIKKPHAENSSKNRLHEIQLQSLMLVVYMLQVTGGFKTIPFHSIIKRLEKQFGNAFILQRRQFILELSKQRIQVDAICTSIKKLLTPTQRFTLLSDLSELCVYENISEENFRKAIVVLGSRLDLQSAEIEKIILQTLSFQNPLHKYFNALGISPDSNYRDTKKAYAALVKKYHPDTAFQYDNNQLNTLNEKFILTKEAFTAICIAKGWK